MFFYEGTAPGDLLQDGLFLQQKMETVVHLIYTRLDIVFVIFLQYNKVHI